MSRERLLAFVAAGLLAIFTWGCAYAIGLLDDINKRHDEICAEDPAACGQATPTPTPAPTPAPTPTPTPEPTPSPTPEPEEGLPAPSGLAAVPHPWRISLSWWPEAWARSYRIYRGNLESPIADVPGTVTTYEADELTLNQRWCFLVAGIDAIGAEGKAARACAMPTFPKPRSIEVVIVDNDLARHSRLMLGLKADYGDQEVPEGMSTIIDATLAPDATPYAQKAQDQARLWCTSVGEQGGRFGQVEWTIRHSSGSTAIAEPAPGHVTPNAGKSNYHMRWTEGGVMLGFRHTNAGKGNTLLVALGKDLPAGHISVQARCLVDPKLESPVAGWDVPAGNATPPAKTD